MTEETRQAIVRAAERVLARQGLDRTSIKDIAGEAGVAPGLIYHYFRDKLDLMVAATTEGCRSLEGAWATGDGAPERAAAAFDALKGNLRSDLQVLFCGLLAAGLHEPSIAAEVRGFVERDRHKVTEIVSEIAAGRASHEEIEAIAVAVWGGLFGIVQQALIDPALDGGAAIDALSAMAFGLAKTRGWT
ncbi:MAG: TetR/AcrR family transcriptional regulator [Acidimicrobiales bacterium]